MKNIIIAVFISLLSTGACSVDSIKATIAKDFARPSWRIDDIVISVSKNCEIRPSHGLSFPELYCSPAYITIEDVINSKSTQKGSSRVVTLSARQASITTNSKNNLGHAYAVFDALNDLSDVEATLTIETKSQADGVNSLLGSRASRKVVLSGFGMLAPHYEYEIGMHFHRQWESQKIRHLPLILGFVVVLAIAIWVAVKMIKLIVSGSKASIATAGKNLEDRKIRRIAKDEAIRATVRKNVDSADEVDLDALKNRIKAALDAGDTETASMLLVLLKHHSG